MTIKIIDTGTGISPEGQSKLFMDFGKLDENAHLNREGTGLGLSICKKIIEQQGGTVTVKSRVDKGTMFTINLGTKCMLRNERLIYQSLVNSDDSYKDKPPNYF